MEFRNGRVARLLGPIVMLLLVFGLANGAMAQKMLKYDGDDDNEFSSKLVKWLENNDVTIQNQGESWVSVKGESFIIAFQPKLSADGLDRIIANMFLTVKSSYKSGAMEQQLNDFVWKLNNSLNTAQFALDGDKDLVMLSQITFVDELSIKEVKAFISWFDQSVLTLMVAAPEALEILE